MEWDRREDGDFQLAIVRGFEIPLSATFRSAMRMNRLVLPRSLNSYFDGYSGDGTDAKPNDVMLDAPPHRGGTTMDCAQTNAEVWAWLRPWWNFWADATALFDWKALAALGTAAAVYVALRRDDRADKRAWMKERALLLALADIAESVVAQTRNRPNLFPEFLKDGAAASPDLAAEELHVLDRLGLLESANKIFEKVPLSELSSAQSIAHWTIAHAALRQVCIEVERARKGQMAAMGFNLPGLEKVAAQFKADARRLEKRSYPLTFAIRKTFH